MGHCDSRTPYLRWVSAPEHRNETTGRFVADGFRDPLTLYHAVRAIATHAAELVACDPLRLSRKQFNTSRATWPEPRPPSAKEIQRRLRRLGEQYLPWRKLLEDSFQEEVSLGISHVQQRQTLEDG